MIGPSAVRGPPPPPLLLGVDVVGGAVVVVALDRVGAGGSSSSPRRRVGVVVAGGYGDGTGVVRVGGGLSVGDWSLGLLVAVVSMTPGACNSQVRPAAETAMTGTALYMGRY